MSSTGSDAAVPAATPGAASGGAPAAAPRRRPPLRRLLGLERSEEIVAGDGGTLPISLVSTVLILGAWWIASHLAWVPPIFLPTPEAVVQRFLETLNEPYGETTLIGHTLWSLVRVFSAFALACATAIPVGIAMGISRVVRGLFDPPIEFYRPLPPLAYLPLIVIWFGIGELSKIILIYLAIFAPLALSARAGVRSVAAEQLHAARSLGASRRQAILFVVLPAALPEILTGMRIGMGFGWTTLVAAEMVAATQGLGQMVLNASSFLVTDVVIMGIVVIGVIALLIDCTMRWLERRLVPWKGRV
ncbi:ABC transporter permease subunit [Azospirillum sp. ST 5-10]|uniref:ABC transporter permease subunit n=1 Tax=unclassified Azospirillum TaxID=2630922 RepID=UPI003F49C4DF